MKKIKKYYVTDEDGSKYTVEEELEESTNDEDIEEDVKTEIADESETFTAEEIAALKKLAAVADKLMANVSNEVTDEDEEIEDEDAEEEILDTDEDIEVKATDSKKSFGSIGSKNKAKDSINDAMSIEDAWQKRYGG